MMRHRLSTRLWHWINLLCLAILLMSGLNISNAHRFLYWGDWGFAPWQAWLHVPRFAGWATIPDYYSLGQARSWHFLAAWPYSIGLLLIWIAMLMNGHFRRNIAPTGAEWRPSAIKADLKAYLNFEFDHANRYGFLQKLAYGVVYCLFLPMMIVTGLAISPGIEPVFVWAVDLLGGRQSARSLHFIFAALTLGFVLVHIAMVLVSGPLKQIRGMITGARA